jgi:hypothetical protein
MGHAEQAVGMASLDGTGSELLVAHPEDCICPRCPFGHALRLDHARPWIAPGINGFPAWARMVKAWSHAETKRTMKNLFDLWDYIEERSARSHDSAAVRFDDLAPSTKRALIAFAEYTIDSNEEC